MIKSAITWDGEQLTVIPQLWLERLQPKADQVQSYPPVYTDMAGAKFNKYDVLALTYLGCEATGEAVHQLIKGNSHNYSSMKNMLDEAGYLSRDLQPCTLFLLTTNGCYRLAAKGTTIRGTNITDKLDIACEDIQSIRHILQLRGSGVLASAHHLLKAEQPNHSRLVIRDNGGVVSVQHLGHVGVMEKIKLAYLLGKGRVFKPVRDFAN